MLTLFKFLPLYVISLFSSIFSARRTTVHSHVMPDYEPVELLSSWGPVELYKIWNYETRSSSGKRSVQNEIKLLSVFFCNSRLWTVILIAKLNLHLKYGIEIPPLLGNVPLIIVASGGGVSRRRPRFANRHIFKLWADSFHEARTLNKVCCPNFCDLRWVRSLWRDCRINWNAMFSWLLEGKNFQDGGVMRLGRTATLYYRMLSSIAKFKSHFLFLFSFWWASEANWNNLKLGIEVIRNFREVNIFNHGLHW